MTVSDIIARNEADTVVKVIDTDVLVETYYHGKLGEIPDKLRNKQVISTGWLFSAQCYGIEIEGSDKK